VNPILVKHVAFLLALACCCAARAQDLNFRHYGVDQGLPSSQVHDILQDTYGNLWFTTDRGLSRFDGYEFKNYTTADGLTDNSLFKFHVGPDGKIWCTTFNRSIFHFSGRDPVFTPYRFNDVLLGLREVIVSQVMHVTASGELYMSFVNAQGYLHLDAAGKILKKPGFQTTAEMNRCVLLSHEKQPEFFYVQPPGETAEPGSYWSGRAATASECWGYDFVRACYFRDPAAAVFVTPKRLSIVRPGRDTLRLASSHDPISLGRLNDSLFWVGYRYGGVSIYDLHGKLIRSFLAGKSVTKLLADHENGFWISTLNDGVFYARNTLVMNFTPLSRENDWIHSLVKDADGKIWIGYYNGNVDVIERHTLRNIYRPQVQKPALVTTDPPGKTVFYSSDLRVYNVTAGDKLNANIGPACLYAASPDSIWCGAYAGVYLWKTPDTVIFRTGFRVNAICRYKGDMYLGSNKGLYKLQVENGVRSYEKIRAVPETGISDLKILGETLAIATRGKGILFYNGASIGGVDEKSGLSNAIINSIYAENDSVLWACTNNGLNRIRKKAGGRFEIKIISYQQGLISNELTGMVLRDDTAWVGTRQGLCFFSTRALDQVQQARNYFLSVQQISINDRKAELRHDRELPYDQNRIELSYGAVSFSSIPIVYRYKLEGLQESWTYTSALKALYPALPPGVYTFVVQVKGDNESWSAQEKRFRFTILPPFWKTWWFIISCFVAGALLIYLFFKYRIFSYNRDITRELLRQLLKRFTRKTNYVVFREQGKDIRIPTHTICYVKAEGNYIEIHTDARKHLVRFKISEFPALVPDPLEYLRISRSYIIRLDKVQEKSKKDVTVKGQKLPVGETYLDELKKIKFKA